MALEEAAAWLDGDLVLPIAGKKYSIPEPTAELGIRLEVLLNSANRTSDRYQQVLSDQEERDLYEDLLGPVYDQMIGDGISYPVLKLAAVTAMTHFVVSPEVAEKMWNDAVSKGKAPAAPSRSSRPATRATTGAASTTRRPASGSGTRSRRSS